jgi:hypothetical protein
MNKLVTLLALIPMSVAAQTSPTLGCYVDSTGYCSTGRITCGLTYDQNLAAHGYTVAQFCQTVRDLATQSEAALAAATKALVIGRRTDLGKQHWRSAFAGRAALGVEASNDTT